MLHAAVSPSLPATAVTHTLAGVFSTHLPPEVTSELLVVRCNQLILYHVVSAHSDIDEAAMQYASSITHDGHDDTNENGGWDVHSRTVTTSQTHSSTRLTPPHNDSAPPKQTLRVEAELSLYAPVVDIALCRPANAATDALVLLFGDFHISFLEYDAQTQNFVTIALVQLDERECSVAGSATLPSMLRTDPSKTHIAVLCKRTDLYLFRVHERVSAEEFDKAALSHAHSASQPHDATSAATTAAPAVVSVTVGQKVAGDGQSTITNTCVALNAWGDEEEDDIAADTQSNSIRNDNGSIKDKDDTCVGGNVSSDAATAGLSLSSATHASHTHAKSAKSKSSSAADRTSSSAVLRISPVFHVVLRELKSTLLNVRDCCFVEASSEPLLALLYEPQPTWAGRVKLVEWRRQTIESHMLTCAVAWVTVSMLGTGQPRVLPMGEVYGIPYNCTHMLPLPALAQGAVASSVLCLAANMLLHVSTSGGYAAYLNPLGKDEAQQQQQQQKRWTAAGGGGGLVYAAMQWVSVAQGQSLERVRTNLTLQNCLAIHIKDVACGNKSARSAVHFSSTSRAAPASHSYHQQRRENGEVEDENENEMAGLRLLIVTEEEGTVVEMTAQVDGHSLRDFRARILMTGCLSDCAADVSSWNTLVSGSSRSAAADVGCNERCLFLGSARGDSRLVRYNISRATLRVSETLIGLGTVHDMAVIRRGMQRATASRTGDSNSNSSDVDENDDAVSRVMGMPAAHSPYAALLRRAVIAPESFIPETMKRASAELALGCGLGSSGSVHLLRHSVRDVLLRREEVDAESVFFLRSPGSYKTNTNNSYNGGDDDTHSSDDNDSSASSAAALWANTPSHLLMTGVDFTILLAVRGDAVEQVLGSRLEVTTRTRLAAVLPWAHALLQVTDSAVWVLSADGKRRLGGLNWGDDHSSNSTGYDHAAEKSDSSALSALHRIGELQAAHLMPGARGVLLHFVSGALYHVDISLAPSASTPAPAPSLAPASLLLRLTHVRQGVAACAVWLAAATVAVVMRSSDLVLLDAAALHNVRARFVDFASCHEIVMECCEPEETHEDADAAATVGSHVPPSTTNDHPINNNNSTNTTNTNVNSAISVTHLAVVDHGRRSEAILSSRDNVTAQTLATLVVVLSSGELMTYTLRWRSGTENGHPRSATHRQRDTSHGIHSNGSKIMHGGDGADVPARLRKSLYHFLDVAAERESTGVESIAEKRRRLRAERAEHARDTRSARTTRARIIPLDPSILGYAGVYVCGDRPAFLLYHRAQDRLLLSAHWSAGPVRGFCPFAARSVRGGFVYCSDGAVRFAQAQRAGVLMDRGWWVQRIPLAATPHHIVYSDVWNDNHTSSSSNKDSGVSCPTGNGTNQVHNGATEQGDASGTRAPALGQSGTFLVVTSTLEPFAPSRASFDVQLGIHYDEATGVTTSRITAPIALPALTPQATHGGPVPMNARYAICCMATRAPKEVISPASDGSLEHGEWYCADSWSLEPNEKVLAAACVTLPRDRTWDVGLDESGVGPVCALATAFPLGEDVTTRGRVVLLVVRQRDPESVTAQESRYAVLGMKRDRSALEDASTQTNESAAAVILNHDHTDDANATTSNSSNNNNNNHASRSNKSACVCMKEPHIYCLHSEPMPGPVTAVAGVMNDIVVAVGGMIRVMRYNGQRCKLETMAMLYAHVYVTTLSTMKNYIVYGDLLHSCGMVRYSAANHILTPLAKDVHRLAVVSSEMMFHDRAFGVVVSDESRHLLLLGYTPRVLLSSNNTNNDEAAGVRASSKIIESVFTIDGEYRTAAGSVVKMLRSHALRAPSTAMIYVTQYGEVGFVIPLNEQSSRTGQWVARRLQEDVPHPAGLPPRMFLGASQASARWSVRGKEQLLHAPLLEQLLRLDLRTRRSVAVGALTQIDRVLTVGATLYAETCIY